MIRLLESIALGTAVLLVAGAAVAPSSAAFTGADSSMAQAAASAVRVASLGALLEWGALLECDALLEIGVWLMAFIKIITF